jgi:hypothetical protein
MDSLYSHQSNKLSLVETLKRHNYCPLGNWRIWGTGNITGIVTKNGKPFFCKSHIYDTVINKLPYELFVLKELAPLFKGRDIFPRLVEVLDSNILILEFIPDIRNSFLEILSLTLDLLEEIKIEENSPIPIIPMTLELMREKWLPYEFWKNNVTDTDFFLCHSDISLEHVKNWKILDWEDAVITNIPWRDLAYLNILLFTKNGLRIPRTKFIHAIEHEYKKKPRNIRLETLLNWYMIWFHYGIHKLSPGNMLILNQ